MNIKNLYRYSIDEGLLGGVVIAESLADACNKIKKKYGDKDKYGDKNEIEVWQFLNDDYYDEDNKDVVECYGLG